CAPRASPLCVAMIVTAAIINASVQRALVISNLHRPNSGLHDAPVRAPRRRPVDHGWPARCVTTCETPLENVNASADGPAARAAAVTNTIIAGIGMLAAHGALRDWSAAARRFHAQG